MNKILRTIWNEFIYGGHLQCLGVVGITYTSSFLLNLEASWEILILSYLIFYPIYIYDRFRGVKMDEVTNPERSRHFEGYLFFIPKLIIFSIFLIISLLIYIGITSLFIFSFTFLVLGILYPIYFKGLTKKIIAFKNIFVSGFFTVIAILPVIFYSHNLDFSSKLTLMALMLLIFIKTMLMQILLDCKDVKGDKPLKLLTVPVVIGKDKSLLFLRTFSILGSLLILVPAIIFLPDFSIKMAVLLLVIPFNFYTYHLSQKDNYMGYVIGSGEFVLWFALIFTVNLIV